MACPKNAKGRGVKNCQGDLFLCRECEEVRFPSTPTTKKNTKQVPDNKKTKQTQQRRPGGKSAHLSIVSDDDRDQCGQCLLTVEDGSSRVIKCDACQQLIHQHCTNMSEKVFDIFIKIKSDVGWVCEVCVESLRARERNLQTAMVTLSEEVASVKCELANMKDLVSNNVTDTVLLETDTTDKSGRSRSVSLPDQKISQVVHLTLHDVEKRKRNVVVTGLPENSNTDDRAEFLKLCETHLSCKPYIVKCDRLGQVVNGRPRRLLVRLSSDIVAAEVLRSAPALRHASDALTANIYINPDLSPTEAKLAYEARQRRRERMAQRPTTDADRAVDRQDQGTATTTTATTPTTTVVPAAAANAGITATTTTTTTTTTSTTPSSLADTTVPVETVNVPFRNQ